MFGFNDTIITKFPHWDPVLKDKYSIFLAASSTLSVVPNTCICCIKFVFINSAQEAERLSDLLEGVYPIVKPYRKAEASIGRGLALASHDKGKGCVLCFSHGAWYPAEPSVEYRKNRRSRSAI